MVVDRTRGRQAKIVDPTALGASTSKPIVVLGDVGVGKTSFFENLYHSLDADHKKNTIFIHVNLGLKATLVEDVRTLILREIPREIKKSTELDIGSMDFCERVYVEDFKEFEASPDGLLKDDLPADYLRAKVYFINSKINEHDQHLKKSLEYISKTLRKLIIIVIDNADQRKFEVQQEAFLIAQELAGAGSGLGLKLIDSIDLN